MKKAPGRAARPFRSIKGKPSNFIESVVNAYDPDKEFRYKVSDALIPKFLKAMEGKKKPDLIASARLFEINRFGAYRIRKVENSEEFRKAMEAAKTGAKVAEKLMESGIVFREASKFTKEQREECQKLSESQKFREDFAVSSNTNNPSLDPFNEYIPIMGGPFSHQLYLHDFLDMLAKAFEAWNHNPLAHQIVKITTHFVLGRGVTFKAGDPDVQERFQLWWDKNDMHSRLEFWSDMLSRDGELMIRRFVNPMTKEMFVRWIDPSTIWEIVTDIEDIETVYYYHQQYPTAYQVLYGAPHGARFDPSKFESSKYIINQIAADEVHHIKANCSPNEKRGRTDLFPILGWLKRYKDFQTAIVLRAIVQSTFAWKNKLKGNGTDVDAFISEFGTDQPEFGSVWVENEASDLTPMVADVKSGAGLADCPGVVNAIAVGSGVPKEYLGLSDHGTRATAVVASEPGVKKFQARQLLLGRLLKGLAQEWFKNEVANGKIKLTKPAEDGVGEEKIDGNIEFLFPEIAVEDRTAKLGDIETTQQAGYISKRRAATMAAKELGIEDYNFDDEQDEIAEEGANDLSTLYPKGGLMASGTADDVAGAVTNALGAGAAAPPGSPSPATSPEVKPQPPKSGGLSGQERRDIKTNDRH